MASNWEGIDFKREHKSIKIYEIRTFRTERPQSTSHVLMV